MIHGRNRFHGRNSLNGVYRKGKIIRVNSLTLRYMPSRRDDYRLAVVVSKKVSKSAVVRNRIRRRIFETVRLYIKDKTISCPYDLVLTVFDEDVAGLEPADLKDRISQLLDNVSAATSA
jgi:ribonuclease P protein component